ncbi:MAG TPA: hypothetical protein ENN77_01225, partial [Candidatus Wirthbacteria bacterium]|nr:hypothetical protein [Candidatus Wirthbacteria bacterium]
MSARKTPKQTSEILVMDIGHTVCKIGLFAKHNNELSFKVAQNIPILSRGVFLDEEMGGDGTQSFKFDYLFKDKQVKRQIIASTSRLK